MMDNTTYTKIDDNTLEIVSTPVVDSVKTIVTYSGLIMQRDAIQKSKDNFDNARNAELAIVDRYLAKCDELKIVLEEVLKPIPAPIHVIEPIIN